MATYDMNQDNQQVRFGKKMYISKYENIITKEKLQEDMYILKLNIEQIRRKYNVGSSVIQNLQKKYNLEILNLYQRRVPEEMTYEQKQVICGTSIADGHIFRKNDNRNGALKICHSVKWIEYLEYKFEILKDFVRTKPTTQISKVENSVSVYKSFRTLTHSFFTEIHEEIYIKDLNGKYIKHLNEKILSRIDSLGLAVAYMDDGTKHHKCRDFCFECFSYVEQEIFVSWLKNKFDVNASIIKYGDKYRTRIIKNSVNDFVKIIEPYILKCMEYKL